MGLSKSTVSAWKKIGNAPTGEKLQRVADYFSVSVDYLLGSEDTKKAPAEAEAEPTRETIRFALSGEVKDLKDEEIDEIVEFAKFVRMKRRNKYKNDA